MAVQTQRPRRRWRVAAMVVAALVVVAFVAFQLGDSASRIDYFRALDERTLAMGTVSGPHAWARVTSVSETASTVTVTVRTFFLQLGPSTALGHRYESLATLHDPLAGRAVIDGTTGQPIQQVSCSPPAFDASPCPDS